MLLAAHRSTFCLWSEDAGTREFSGGVRAATNVAATDFISYNFTEITTSYRAEIIKNYCLSASLEDSTKPGGSTNRY